MDDMLKGEKRSVVEACYDYFVEASQDRGGPNWREGKFASEDAKAWHRAAHQYIAEFYYDKHFGEIVGLSFMRDSGEVPTPTIFGHLLAATACVMKAAIEEQMTNAFMARVSGNKNADPDETMRALTMHMVTIGARLGIALESGDLQDFHALLKE